MKIELIAFLIFISAIFALLEIQIEGENGWADRLPTWKVKNPFKLFINWPYITGYHLYLYILFLSILHLPFLLGLPFILKNEILIFEIFLIIMLVEDFLWFVFNPKWGMNRFFTQEIPWHPKKILFLPQNYWVGFVILAIIEILRRQILFLEKLLVHT